MYKFTQVVRKFTQVFLSPMARHRFSTGFDVLATNTSPLDPVTKPDMTIHTDISEIIGK